jgi:hypothetical protein
MGVGSTEIARANTYAWWGTTGEICLVEGLSTRCAWSGFSSAVGMNYLLGAWLDLPFLTHFYNGLSNFMSVWGGPDDC